MRLYGTDLCVANSSEFNCKNTEFAVIKSTFYGPDSTVFVTTDCSMTIDFGPTIPGFSGRDTGGVDYRPMISASSPRLSWIKYGDPQGSEVIMQGQFNITNLPTTIQPANVTDFAIGCVDVTVHIRRGYVST